MASPALDPDVQAFRMPAEWEPHEATWLGWPHNLSDWPGRFAPIPWVYGEIVRKLAEGESVRILVPSKAHEAKARRVLERVGAATRAGRVLPLPDRPRLDARLRPDLRAARAPEARGGGRPLPLQRLGQVPRPQEGRPGRRARREGARPAAAPGRPQGPAGRARRRSHRRGRQGHAPHHRGVPARPVRAGAQPRLQARRLRAGLPREPGRDATRSGSGRGSPATTPTATSTTSAAS